METKNADIKDRLKEARSMEKIYKLKTHTVMKIQVAEPETSERVSDPESAVKILKAIYETLDADQEHFTILCLDKGNKITGFKTLFSGAIDQTVVDPRILFRYALLTGASALILAHNHPSGRKEPSAEDFKITKTIQDGASLLQIKIIDHIILADGYFSFRENGVL